ncbi:hypothetical protein GCM10023196_006680 [Actinoallomurus vinaceus]|uniref:Uncharacterized protein n=1 Tax=Actinoallomurus vinaceus TaxID=1080074 RepID=A0ABP8U0C1_9ACTN
MVNPRKNVIGAIDRDEPGVRACAVEGIGEHPALFERNEPIFDTVHDENRRCSGGHMRNRTREGGAFGNRLDWRTEQPGFR